MPPEKSISDNASAVRFARSGGFALLAALLVSSLLAAMATSFVVDARTLSMTTRGEIDLAQARALADAGARIAALQLHRRARGLAPLPEGPKVRPGSRAADWRFAGGTVAISVEAEASKLDLNTANIDALSGLFEAAGESATAARRHARAILAYRRLEGSAPDGASGSGPDGMIRLRMSWELDGRAFDSVGDLSRVPSFPAGLAARIAPQVTVHGGQRRGDADGKDTGAVYTVLAKARTSTGAQFHRRAIVDVAPSTGPRFVIWD